MCRHLANKAAIRSIPSFASPTTNESDRGGIRKKVYDRGKQTSEEQQRVAGNVGNVEHSPAVMTMMDVFYGQMRPWIESLRQAAKPLQSKATRQLRAALITAQIEGLMILIGPNRVGHAELCGLEKGTITQMMNLALSD
jgi:hypothetical protein